MAYLPDLSERAAHRAALDGGVEAVPLSSFASRVSLPAALLLGFAAFKPSAIREGASVLAQALARLA